ncbi:MAG: hypothetical protein ACI97K_000676 [Glaciecola sp.]|jgi:hypothetical protein
MRNWPTCIGILLLISMPLYSAIGKQTSFTKRNTSQGIEFAYRWLSTDGNSELKFVLSNENLKNLPNSSPAYNPMLAQNFVRQNLLRYAKTVDPKIAKISIRQSGNSINMEVSGSSQAKISEIQNVLSEKHEQAEAQYLYDNYYIPFKSEVGKEAIKQDHKRYALESYKNLTSIVSAIKNQLENPNNDREFVNFTLNWLQAIPYDTMENRISSNGSGFAAPQQLLRFNKGDCDSKSTLFLALLKAYKPTIKAQMIFLPNHALVGINLNPINTDTKIIQNNDVYVLAEPTGPANYELGRIAPSSQLFIRNRQFTTEEFYIK